MTTLSTQTATDETCRVALGRRGRVVHFSIDVRNAITGTGWKWVSSPDGKRVTKAEAIEYLMDELAKGHLFLPIGHCDAFNYQAGCPGHPSPLPGEEAQP